MNCGRRACPKWETCRRLLVLGGVAGLLLVTRASLRASEAPEGWESAPVREEMQVHFAFNAGRGPNGRGEWVIELEGPGDQGYWHKTFPVEGGKTYRFSLRRAVREVENPRRSVVPRILWQDDQGRPVPYDGRVVDYYRSPGSKSMARPEYPLDAETNAAGWTSVTGVYRAPSKATRARIELRFRWAAGGRVAYSDVKLEPTKPLEARNVRLATIHYKPRSRTPKGNREEFAPLIAKAAKQGADLVLLPETLTYFGVGKSYGECAEPVPGPSTEYFGKLAAKHDLYIVAGLLERDGRVVYNVAALIGPDGKLVGKYRKVCLPRSEVEGGVTPGESYPVFETRFGKVGMMVCYDGFFPEVARQLSNHGAEVIAWPVWGCNPLLGRARACENQVYVVSSTYTDSKSNWIVSGIFDHTGELLDYAKDWGDVVVVEVDLNRRTVWSGLGDFRAEMTRHRPGPQK